MFDLKVINSVLGELEEVRGIPREKIIEAIEAALATAYKKEYGKRGQIIRAKFDIKSGAVEFVQVKEVVDKDSVIFEDEAEALETHAPEAAEGEANERVIYNPEHHILIEDAKMMKRGAVVGEEIIFPIES